MTSASSRSGRRFTRSAAVNPSVGSMRMSSGPSALTLNPRSASSSCIELTPMSTSTPSGASPARRSGISRKSACSKRTRSPNSRRRVPDCASAAGSLSKARRRPSGALRRRISAACPPRPTVPSTYSPPGLTASSSMHSARRTGWCRGTAPLDTSDPEPGKHAPVLVRERLLLAQALREPLLVQHREVVLQAEHAHLARHGRALAQELRQHDAPLLVHRHRLAEEVHPVEEALLRRIGGRNFGQTALDLEPHRHRIDAHVFAGDAGDEELGSVLLLDEHTKPVGDLESPLLVDARRMVSSQHAQKLAFVLVPSARCGDPCPRRVTGSRSVAALTPPHWDT